MTASRASRGGDDKVTPVLSSTPLNFSRVTMDRKTLPSCPPCLPYPYPSSSSFAHEDFPSSLALPTLASRAPTRGRQADEATPASLMGFIQFMSISDSEAGRPCFAPPLMTRSSFLLSARSSPPPLEEEPSATTTLKNEIEEDSSSCRSRRSSSIDFQSLPLGLCTLTTPETTKTTITSLQSYRPNTSQKRKSPLVQFTPVDGNQPLLLPALSAPNNVPRATFSCHPGGRHPKKAKNYKSWLTSAPMLPSSPDLEDRVTGVTWYHPPCFSPVGGVTLVNPNYRRHLLASVGSPPPLVLPPPVPCGVGAAGLPSLDDEPARCEPKSLPIKRRGSLLSALRLVAAEGGSI